MLDRLDVWCKLWGMNINSSKTKVVHFRPQSTPRSAQGFMCGQDNIDIIDQYKYLGLILTEHLDYQITAKMVAQSASRALGLVIAKSKAYGGMPFDCYTKLYEAMVQSIINYGAAVWGTREFSCISAVYHRASRYFMGLGKYAPNAAVQGDMGLKLPIHHQWVCVTRQWCRMINMTSSRVNKKVFEWACELNKLNWSGRIRKMYTNLHVSHLSNINQSVCLHSAVREVSGALKEYTEQLWQEKLNREQAVRGASRNKLRTYRSFKKDFFTEPYLRTVLNKKHRSALAKFRCGVAPLHIETGRYVGRSLNDRVCFNCPTEIASEEHVILFCDIYSDLQLELYTYASGIKPDFMAFLPQDKLQFLLNDASIVKKTAKTLNDILESRRSFLYIS